MGVEMMILHIVLDLRRPGVYLHEVARELFETLGAEVSILTIIMYVFEEVWLYTAEAETTSNSEGQLSTPAIHF